MKKIITGIAVISAVFILGVLVGVSGDDNKPVSASAPDSVTTQSKTIKDTGKVEVNGNTRKTIDNGYTKVVGEVKNNSSRSALYVKVIATFYDNLGSVIGTGYSYAGDTPNTPLEVGATTPFEVKSYPDKIDASKYKLDISWE